MSIQNFTSNDRFRSTGAASSAYNSAQANGFAPAYAYAQDGYTPSASPYPAASTYVPQASQQQQVYQPSVYRPAVNQQPVYQQPVFQQPVYQQPVYQQPVYQQPVYQQPVYQQPVYQQPVYQQPVYPQTATYPQPSTYTPAPQAAPYIPSFLLDAVPGAQNAAPPAIPQMQTSAPYPYAAPTPQPAPTQAYPQNDPRYYGETPRLPNRQPGFRPGAPVPTGAPTFAPPLPGLPNATSNAPFAPSPFIQNTAPVAQPMPQPAPAYPQPTNNAAPLPQPTNNTRPVAPVARPPVAQPTAPARIDLPGLRPGVQLTLDANSTVKGYAISGSGVVNAFDGQRLDMTVQGSAAMGLVKMTLHLVAQQQADGSIHLTATKVDGGAEQSMLDQTLQVTSNQPGNLALRTSDGQAASMRSDGRGGFAINQGENALSFHTA